MTNPQLIRPILGSTPAHPSQPRAIPSDLLREASQRLGVMALLGAALWTIGTTSYHLALRAIGGGPRIGLLH